MVGLVKEVLRQVPIFAYKHVEMGFECKTKLVMTEINTTIWVVFLTVQEL